MNGHTARAARAATVAKILHEPPVRTEDWTAIYNALTLTERLLWCGAGVFGGFMAGVLVVTWVVS